MLILKYDKLLSIFAFKFNLRLYTSEIYSARIRGTAMSLCFVVHWIFNFVIGQTFLPAVQAVGGRGLHSFTFQLNLIAVSDTQRHTTHPKHPLNMGYTTPTRTPYHIKSAQVELRSERV